MVVEPTGNLRLSHSLFGTAGKSGNHDRRRFRPSSGGAHRNLQDRSVQADVTDCELGRVYTDSKAPCAGIEIIASKPPLPANVKFTFSIQRKGMCRNDSATPQCREHLFRPVDPAQFDLP